MTDRRNPLKPSERMKIKRQESLDVRSRPHPREVALYLDV